MRWLHVKILDVLHSRVNLCSLKCISNWTRNPQSISALFSCPAKLCSFVNNGDIFGSHFPMRFALDPSSYFACKLKWVIWFSDGYLHSWFSVRGKLRSDFVPLQIYEAKSVPSKVKSPKYLLKLRIPPRWYYWQTIIRISWWYKAAPWVVYHW